MNWTLWHRNSWYSSKNYGFKCNKSGVSYHFPLQFFFRAVKTDLTADLTVIYSLVSWNIFWRENRCSKAKIHSTSTLGVDSSKFVVYDKSHQNDVISDENNFIFHSVIALYFCRTHKWIYQSNSREKKMFPIQSFMITISVRQTFPKFQFSFDWGRTALIVVSGRIPIRELGKAQVLTFIAIFLFKLKKRNCLLPKNFITCSCYRYIKKDILLLGRRFWCYIASQ